MSSDEVTPDIPSDSPRRAPRFDSEPFRPDGVVPPAGLFLLLGGVAAMAAALGCVLGFVGPWMYLVVLFPIAAGALLGGVGRALVAAGRVRNAAVAGTIAGIGGFAMIFAMHYFDYIRDLNTVDWRGMPPANVFDYIDIEAQAGVVIGENPNNGFNLGYAGSYIYFAFEAVLASAFAFGIARGGALAPYCHTCKRWKKPRSLASLPHVPAGVAVEALRAGALLELLETGTPVVTSFGLNLKAFACPRCGGDDTIVAVVEQITTDARGRRMTRAIGQYVYPGEVLALVEDYLPQRQPRLPRPIRRGGGDNPPGTRSEDIRPGT
jgi:hypothetical protein